MRRRLCSFRISFSRGRFPSLRSAGDLCSRSPPPSHASKLPESSPSWITVAHLAQRFAESLRNRQPELGITKVDVMCVKIAGLLHDLGHGPYSHMWDEVFVKKMGISWKVRGAGGVAQREAMGHMTVRRPLGWVFCRGRRARLVWARASRDGERDEFAVDRASRTRVLVVRTMAFSLSLSLSPFCGALKRSRGAEVGCDRSFGPGSGLYRRQKWKRAAMVMGKARAPGVECAAAKQTAPVARREREAAVSRRPRRFPLMRSRPASCVASCRAASCPAVLRRGQHEKGSIEMFRYLLRENGIDLSSFDPPLFPKDVAFVEEMIIGTPSKERRGRGGDKEFLYDIVNNTR